MDLSKLEIIEKEEQNKYKQFDIFYDKKPFIIKHNDLNTILKENATLFDDLDKHLIELLNQKSKNKKRKLEDM